MNATTIRRKPVRSRMMELGLGMMAAAAIAAAVGGCAHHEADKPYPGSQQIGGEIFIPDGETRQVERYTEVQAAVAARTDATLRPYHFDGTELNSLGQHKLDLMAKDDRAYSPFVVYLDLAKDSEQSGRREAVLVYLKDLGMREDQIRTEEGPNLNPDNTHPAANSMRMMHMLDAGAPVGNNSEPGNSAGGAPK